jgi:8-oxo-dGTP diphosphatase
MAVIYKIGLALIRNNKLLVVKDTKGLLIMPGGKMEDGETSTECLKREIKEELGADVVEGSLKFVGKFECVAAGKKDTIIEEDLYLGEVEGEIKPQGEIDELIWVGKDDDRSKLSSIIKYHLLPILIERGYI